MIQWTAPHGWAEEPIIKKGERKMPNASEMQRSDEEAFERAMEQAYNLRISKSGREYALGEVRRLGKLLGYNTKPYNGHPDMGE